MKTLNLKDWLGSKKTKDMMWTQGIMTVLGIAVVWFADGNPEKVKGILESMTILFSLIAGVGTTKLTVQAAIDHRIAKNKAEKSA